MSRSAEKLFRLAVFLSQLIPPQRHRIPSGSGGVRFGGLARRPGRFRTVASVGLARDKKAIMAAMAVR